MAKVVVKQPEKEKSKIAFVIRAKQSPDSEYWQSCGVAFEANINGAVGYSLKLNSLPTNWTGDLLMMPPLEEKE